MRKLFLTLLGCMLIGISCQNDLEDNYVVDKNEEATKPLSELERFSLLLSKAVSNSTELRTFIRNESLKMVDNDYDVFYPIVKDKLIKDNISFRDILKQFDYDNELGYLEQQLPLLTIYVPELPSDFNAENWKSIEEIPHITTRVKGRKTISYYRDGNADLELPSNLIPGFPVLVVKNNERIVEQKSITRGHNPVSVNDRYSFIDAEFDGINNKKTVAKTRAVEPALFEQSEIAHLKTAYDEMGVSGEYWQRDNIYYGLTPTNTSGALKRNIVEYIKMLKFTYEAFLKMKDQPGDPDPIYKILGKKSDYSDGISPEAFWQDGRFEFKIDVTINNQSGLGTNITKFISVEPSRMFYTNFTRKDFKAGWMWFSTFEITSIVGTSFNTDIKLITWDLQQNSFSWKFNFSEVDDQETYTTQETITSEFATNFGVDLKKIGLNFGSSSKITKQSQFTRVIYKNSDELGTLEVNFSDPILISYGNTFWLPLIPTIYNFCEIYMTTNPMVEIGLAPMIEY